MSARRFARLLGAGRDALANCTPTSMALALALAALSTPSNAADAPPSRPVKVLVISMFTPEAEPWIAAYHLDELVPVAGLDAEHPALRCNADDVCLLTTGMGHANAAASTMAVAMSPALDLTHTWFLVAGIAGIDPAQGTLGSAAWARWLVDFGLVHELDAREMPRHWAGGHYGLLTAGPGIKPRFDYHNEAVRLDERLLQKALALSRGAVLADDDAARTYRARYTGAATAAARRPPSLLQCDTLAADSWWHGDIIGKEASAWTRLLTDGQGTYCTTQQEDNATWTALSRGAAAGRLDLARLAVLRTASNFDRAHPGQTAAASLQAAEAGGSGGFGPATQNLVIVGGRLVDDIVARWPLWKDGVPE